jgi:hypothetical protein
MSESRLHKHNVLLQKNALTTIYSWILAEYYNKFISLSRSFACLLSQAMLINPALPKNTKDVLEEIMAACSGTNANFLNSLRLSCISLLDLRLLILAVFLFTNI